MSLSDCEKCWSTPCECGFWYRNYSVNNFKEFIGNVISGYFKYKNTKEPTKTNPEKEEFFKEIEIYIKSKNEN